MRVCDRSRPHRGFDSPEHHAGGRRCASRQENAHNTKPRMVLYRWHPWHGRAVFVRGAVSKGEHATYLCTLEEGDGGRALEVPQWMFDAAACYRTVQSPTSFVTCDALRDLRHLIEQASGSDELSVLQIEHLSGHDPGGADAKQESAFRDSDGIVSPACGDSAMGRDASRSTPGSAGSVSPAAVASTTRTTRGKSRSAGAR